MSKPKKGIISLVDMGVDQKGIITSLEEGDRFKARLNMLNIRIGKKIKKISSTPFQGPVVVEIDNSRVAIGHGMARKIMVKIIEQKSIS